MIIETKIHKVGGSHMVVIPQSMVEYFKLKPGTCKIEDNGKNEAKLIFKKWN